MPGPEKSDHRFVARRYRYADGVAYRQNVYDLVVFWTLRQRSSVHDQATRVGGALVLKDKAIAYVGHVGGVDTRVKDIISRAEHYAWGNDLRDALEKIKPHLETEFQKRR